MNEGEKDDECREIFLQNAIGRTTQNGFGKVSGKKLVKKSESKKCCRERSRLIVKEKTGS